MGTLSIKSGLLRYTKKLQWKAVKGILSSAPTPVTRIRQLPHSAQQLAQAVIARFNLYPDVSEKTSLLDLMDILVLNCDSTFHRHLAEEGFFQTLISDRKVQLLSPVHLVFLFNSA